MNQPVPQNFQTPSIPQPGVMTPNIPMPGTGGGQPVRPLIRIRRPIIHVPPRIDAAPQQPAGQPAPPPAPAR
jgi:hypothetical protein